MRAMAVAPSGERALVELKAVDAAYPLYGELRARPARRRPAPTPDGRHRVALEASVAERLGLRPGDAVRIGEARLTFAGTIATEPDRVASPAVLGPRAMILADALPATGADPARARWSPTTPACGCRAGTDAAPLRRRPPAGCRGRWRLAACGWRTRRSRG